MAIAGNARISRKLTTRVIQVNTGSFIMVIPGARILIMVVMKLKEAKREATPRIWRENPKIWTHIGHNFGKSSVGERSVTKTT